MFSTDKQNSNERVDQVVQKMVKHDVWENTQDYMGCPCERRRDQGTASGNIANARLLPPTVPPAHSPLAKVRIPIRGDSQQLRLTKYEGWFVVTIRDTVEYAFTYCHRGNTPHLSRSVRQHRLLVLENLKLEIFILAAIAARSAAQLSNKEVIPIISQDSEVNFDGSYRSSYQTGNGITAQEQGVLKNAGNKDAEAEEVQGGFQYTAPDGTPIQLSYIANENGFQPQGAHLPVAPIDDKTPPPIPAAILRSLEYNAAHPEPNEEAPGRRF
ncbi:hypothetical protein NQ317_016678 [Molorchus minor]|uniref:Uncharacterized protein n=1 Tax=Molorchus minor TaxID=1323400 RepID=A0ABQ9J440_9CUCU|nr:hypothetical protein NQ317_016678 [Molorchus minor]